jgi:hypothetical protein
MIRSGSFNMGDLGGAIAALSFIGTLALLILNLRVSGAMSDLKIEVQATRTEFTVQISDTKLSIEKLRGDFYQEQTKLYSQIMTTGSTTYMSRDLSLQMHAQNVKSLEDLGKRIDDLTTRVGDIS